MDHRGEPSLSGRKVPTTANMKKSPAHQPDKVPRRKPGIPDVVRGHDGVEIGRLDPLIPQIVTGLG